MDDVNNTAKLLEVDSQQLNDALVYKTRKVGRDVLKSAIPQGECEANRDSMCKNLFDRLFDWLITSLNASIEPKNESSSDLSTGLLDIFGFENFKFNSFE